MKAKQLDGVAGFVTVSPSPARSLHGRGAVLGLCLALGGAWLPCARADVVTSFDGPTLDAAIHLDVPNPGVGTVNLDTVNKRLVFTGDGADLWSERNGLPYAWTAIPQVGVGGVWRAETEVEYLDWWEWGRIVGLTTYSGPDGYGGANWGQEFTFGLDHWDGPNGVWVQGLGDNRPGDSENLANEYFTDIVDLRMDVTVGNLSTNTYDFSYKLPQDETWINLGTIHDVNDDDRVAMFFKGGQMNVAFNYFNVTAVSPVPEPACLAMIGIGAAGVWLVRLRKKRRT